jgi:predicted nucleotidyltransferase
MSQMTSPSEGKIAALKAFAEQAAATLQDDERVRILWLTGSLASGTADAQSDVDLRVAVRTEDFASVGQWWQDLMNRIAPTVWKRRWPGPPDEVILSAITPDYMRFDIVIQSIADRKPRTLEAAQVLFDKDGLADQFTLTAPSSHNALAHLSYVVEEGIRLLGMLPIVVERDDVPIGMEGQLALHSLLISLLLMENGIDRMSMGKRHVAAFLNEEQRAVLAQAPILAPTMASVIESRVAYGRLFLPRARRLMEANGLAYPEAFEAATRRSLQETLGLNL